MAKFEPAVTITLDPEHEGGFQKNPNDRANWTGGEIGVGELVGTNGGITALDMPGADIEHLTLEQKMDFYRERYWKPFFNDIESQDVANKLFDLGVLFGIGQAVKGIQDALSITADGDFGPVSLAKVNESDPKSLLSAYEFHMVQLAIAIGVERPSERGFVGGWIKRVNS